MNRFLLAATCLISAGTSLFAHGIHCTVERAGAAVVVTCAYDGNTPVADADVTLYAPSDMESVFQAGKTDPNGTFAFVPDADGVWRFVIDDGTGHRAESEIHVDAEHVVQSAPETAHSDADRGYSLDDYESHSHGASVSQIPLLYRIIFGLAVIFGLAGLWYGFKARKE